MNFNIAQVDGLERALKRLEDVYSTYRGSAAAQTQIRSCLKLISDDAKTRVHSITGNLVGGIRVYARVRPAEEIMGEVGVSYARTKAHHAHLVEYGHNVAGGRSAWTGIKMHPTDAAIKKVQMSELMAKAARLNKKNGLTRPRNKGARLSFVPPHPFFAPAVEAKKEAVLKQAADAVSDLMAKSFK